MWSDGVVMALFLGDNAAPYISIKQITNIFQISLSFHIYVKKIKAKAIPIVSHRLWSNLNFPVRIVSGMVVISSLLLKSIIESLSDSTSNGGGTFTFIEGANPGALCCIPTV